MYDRDMPRIAAHGLASAEGFKDVCTFVLLTIQQPLAGVGAQFKDVKRRGRKSRHLFGAKREGFDYLEALGDSLYRKVKHAIETRDTVSGINALLDVPGLGIVKAAFVMQCLGAPDAACIDTHNLARLGLGYGVVKFGKAAIRREQTRLAKIRRYIDLCLEQGNARYWWNSWCEYVVSGERKRASGFASADACSLEHCRALGLA